MCVKVCVTIVCYVCVKMCKLSTHLVYSIRILSKVCVALNRSTGGNTIISTLKKSTLTQLAQNEDSRPIQSSSNDFCTPDWDRAQPHCQGALLDPKYTFMIYVLYFCVSIID